MNGKHKSEQPSSSPDCENMVRCSKCGHEVADSAYFCSFCGADLQAMTSDDLQKIIQRRLDAIQSRDEGILESLFDNRVYTKFDDWPPYTRQEAAQALKNERQAYKVLSSYKYELRDLRTDIDGGAAIVTFHIYYTGTIRGRAFDVNSRVTIVLTKKEQSWRIVHEHWSRFPEERVRRGIFR